MAKKRKTTTRRTRKAAQQRPKKAKYLVTFAGNAVVDGKIRRNPIRTFGTHSFSLPPLPPYVEVRVMVSRKGSTKAGAPNLKITMKRMRKEK